MSPSGVHTAALRAVSVMNARISCQSVMNSPLYTMMPSGHGYFDSEFSMISGRM